MLAREVGFIFFLHCSVKKEKVINRENSQKVEFCISGNFSIKTAYLLLFIYERALTMFSIILCIYRG